MAPLILGQFVREADRECNYFFSHPAEVSGESTTRKAAKEHINTDDDPGLIGPRVVSRPEPCYHPSQKVPRRFGHGLSSIASVGTQTSGEETPELAPDAEVRILSRDSPALMEGADVDVDEDENKGEDDHVDVDEDEDDDDDAILRVSSCHCPASEPDAGQDEDVDEDGDEDEDAERSTPEPSSNDETPDETAAETVTEVSEDQETGPYKPIDKEEADDNTVKDTTTERAVEYGTEGTQTDAFSEHEAITPPTGDPETEDPIANTESEAQTEATKDEEATPTQPADPPRENIAVLIRRKREERLLQISLTHAAESEAKRAKVLIEAEARKPATPEPGPAPAPAPPVDKTREFSASPPGRISVHTRPKPSSYKRAHVLTVHWASSSTREPPAAVRELKAVARRVYGYSVTHCALAPRRHAAGVLAGELAQVVDEYAGTKDEDGNSDTLVILHYVGASRTDADSFRIYPPTWPCRAPLVEVDLQSLLRDTLLSPSFPSDVLVMLDCPYACNIGGTPQAGKEILAASTKATGFCLCTPTRDMKFTWTIARTLAQARYALHPFTDQLEKTLVDDGTHRKGRPARLPEVAGLMVGNGPARRHILLAPIVATWTYWCGPEGETSGGSGSEGPGRCPGCGDLKEDGVACRCKSGPVRGMSLEGGGGEVGRDIELGEVVAGGLFVIGE